MKIKPKERRIVFNYYNIKEEQYFTIAIDLKKENWYTNSFNISEYFNSETHIKMLCSGWDIVSITTC